MAFLIQLLANYAGLIYIGCAIGAAFAVRDILAARSEALLTRFSLEREAASSRIVRSSIMVVLFIGLAIVTLILASNVAPNLPRASSSTPTPSFALPTGTATPTIQPTPTRKPTLTPAPTRAGPSSITTTPEPPTLEPTLLPLPPVSCPAPNVQLTAPASGQIVSGEFQLFGTANAPNFAFYKFTLKGPGTNEVELTAGEPVREAKQAAVLGSLDPSIYFNQPGVYLVGLVVVDNTGSEYPHCVLPIVIQPPAP
jgi:hypothetical protein